MKKDCHECKKSFDIALFHKDSSKHDGIYPICKECRRLRCGYGKQWRKKTTWGIDSNGYLSLKGIRQHRKLMEDFLGRKLKRNEHVHHINGDKTDNRIYNLVVLLDSEHQSLHSREMWSLKGGKSGEVKKCVKCGAEKYYSKSIASDLSKNNYMCQKCYYKSKRWLENITKEKLIFAQKKSIESRLRKTSGMQSCCKYCNVVYDLPPQKHLWRKYCSDECHRLDRSRWSTERWVAYRNNL
jgi:hypothetical protein